jgi:hypothetical protein
VNNRLIALVVLVVLLIVAPQRSVGAVTAGDVSIVERAGQEQRVVMPQSAAGGVRPGAVDAGWYHSCGLRSDGTLTCWGYDDYGQSTPPSGTFQHIDVGGYHSCAIKSDGTLACWGWNNYGQASAPSGTFQHVSSGGYHNCAIKSDGTLACWGWNNYGQASPPSGTFQHVSTGREHSCAIKSNGMLACWGRNDYEQTSAPSGTFQQVSAGWFHTCAISFDGMLACWGHNGYGQASPPSGGFKWVATSLGRPFTCGIKSDSTLACWGSNSDGQATPPGGTFHELGTGGGHSCAIKDDRTVACWGINVRGEATPPSGTFGLHVPMLLSVQNARVTEGNTGTVAAEFSVQLTRSVTTTVTVDYSTEDGRAPEGSAHAGSDYTAASGTLTFLAGTTVQTATVTVHGDTVDEDDEDFLLLLSNPTNAVLGDGQAHAKILDDDGPAITIGDVAVVEGNGGSQTANFPLTLSATSPQTITVRYATADATGQDYTARSGKVIFVPGTIEQTFTVPIIGDTIDETDESFTLTLSSPVDATLADAQASATIQDDDEPALSISDVRLLEGARSTRSVSFKVRLLTSAPAPPAVTVDYATADGSATAAADYTARNGTLTFNPGVKTITVKVPVRGDTTDELDETFRLLLSNATGAVLSDAEATATIVNDDDPTISIDDALVPEGSSGTRDAFLTVVLSHASLEPVTLRYDTIGGTASAGSDYIRRAGKVTFLPGEVRKVLRVPVVGDTTHEADETFHVVLTTPTDATVIDGTGTVTIIDADPSAPSTADALVREGASGVRYAYFEVRLSAAQTSSVRVRLVTADGTAKAETDYQRRSETLLFAAGETRKLVVVVVYGDTLVEANERFRVVLTPPSGVSMADADLNGVIVNDD